jgi:hypothetical protein
MMIAMEKLGGSFEGKYWAPETSTFSTHQTLKFVLCVCLYSLARKGQEEHFFAV